MPPLDPTAPQEIGAQSLLPSEDPRGAASLTGLFAACEDAQAYHLHAAMQAPLPGMPPLDPT
eukprot:CAMPEP_0202386860 /NCGR_PEP_ID=MMETSP1127-20130417/68952_1 /ASSEMBLY_ACC=CAM_ASM_000462 /TAXON_ID=3047 /ORGANISM="Dunaliella tertiolecta, Strain CCMP1320" /LENGTH=61 /DNA_ID=CAMNT_0048987619 /DNA_START=1 /DNA_END=183 /DNA_ORIENTATION=-